MVTYYKVFNPYTGLHEEVTDAEKLMDCLIKSAWDSYMTLTHGIPYTVVKINPDGTQIWSSPTGDELLKLQSDFPAHQKEKFKYQMPLSLTMLGEPNG